MGRTNLIEMGMQSFEVMKMLVEGVITKTIKDRLNLSHSLFSKTKRNLINAGWITEQEGKYQYTESGLYFLKTIYSNQKIRDKIR